VLRIGDFAALAGVSVKMLRHYDERGLLPPARVDPSSGYRYYSPAQLPVVARLVALRGLGFGLDEAGGLLAGDGALDREALAARRRAILAERDELDRRLAALDVFDPAVPVTAKTVPAAAYATRRATVSGEGDVGALFVDVEERVAAAGARAVAAPLALVHGAGGGEVDVEVAVPLAPGAAGAGAGAGVVLPARRVAAAVVVGPYAGVPAAAGAVLAWRAATGHRPCGPVEEAYVRFGAEPDLDLPPAFLADDEAGLVTEVRVPF
jgi:DNA-binding transcriptional MerR regulator